MSRQVFLPLIRVRPCGSGNGSHFGGFLAGQKAFALASCQFLVGNREIVFAGTETNEQRRIQIGDFVGKEPEDYHSFDKKLFCLSGGFFVVLGTTKNSSSVLRAKYRRQSHVFVPLFQWSMLARLSPEQKSMLNLREGNAVNRRFTFPERIGP